MLPYNIDEKFGGDEQDPRDKLEQCGSREQSPAEINKGTLSIGAKQLANKETDSRQASKETE